MNEQRSRPSHWFYVFGLTILFLGCFAALAVFTVGLAGTVSSAVGVDRLITDFDRVVVPGTAEFVLDETGLYAIFYEYRSVVDGVTYDTSRIRPRIDCGLEEKSTGKQVSLHNDWLDNANYELPSRSGTLLMVFEVENPDTYVLSCQYPSGAQAPKVVLAIGTNLLPSILGLAVSVVLGFLAPVPICCGGTIIAALIIIIVAMMRYLSGRRSTSAETED